jgi:hypothetical protein
MLECFIETSINLFSIIFNDNETIYQLIVVIRGKHVECPTNFPT